MDNANKDVLIMALKKENDNLLDYPNSEVKESLLDSLLGTYGDVLPVLLR